MPIWESALLLRKLVEQIRALRPLPADVLVLERLVSKNVLTLDDIIKYVESVETSDYWAGVLSDTNLSTDFVASIIQNISDDRAAQIIGSTNMYVERASRILESPKITWDKAIKVLSKILTDRASKILDLVETERCALILAAMTSRDALRAAQILSGMSTDRAALALSAASMPPAVGAEIVKNVNVDRAAEIMSSPAIGAGRCAQILSLIPSDKAGQILSSSKMSSNRLVEIVSQMSDDKIASIITSVTADRAAIIVQSLSTDRSYGILSKLSGDYVQKVMYAWADSMRALDKLVDLLTYGSIDYALRSWEWYTPRISNRVVRWRNVYLEKAIYLDAQPSVVIAYSINVTRTGSIIKSPTGGGGAGVGGGGLIILTRSLVVDGSICADGARGRDAVRLTDTCVSCTPDQGGVGAGGGYMICVDPDVPGQGGSGESGSAYGGTGGGLQRTSVTKVTSLADIAKEILKAACDWWITSILRKTLTTSKSFPSCYGAGGDAGAGCMCAGAGGGGGGGWIFIFAHELSGSGLISARGGDGGRPLSHCGDYCGAGGGGGGGIVYIVVNKVSSLPSVDVSGGRSGGGGAKDGTRGVVRMMVV